MSRLVLVSVYDRAVGAYMQPMVVRSKGEAMRSFIAGCRSDDNLKMSPSDYVLYQVGYFDDQTCEVVSDVMPIMSAVDAVKIVDGEPA